MIEHRNFKDKNCWLNINKPKNISSAQVVSVVKRITGAKKVGHGGTLDPLAHGVLPIALNRATKTVSKIIDSKKSYIFIIKFGVSTDTDDSKGKVIKTSNKMLSLIEIANIIPHFIGKINQTPSKFSAIKINGKRAYILARKEVEFEIPSREINIFSLSIIDFNGDNAKFEVLCSKGTYIRSLARDICEKLDICGHVSDLARIKVGNFLINQAISLDELKLNNIKSESILYI